MDNLTHEKRMAIARRLELGVAGLHELKRLTTDPELEKELDDLITVTQGLIFLITPIEHLVKA